MPGDYPDIARRAVSLADLREPTLGLSRLICIDGLAGSGKTTLAGEIAALCRCPVIHMDDLYPGWQGLGRVAEQVHPMLRALAAGHSGHHRRWDWEADCYSADVIVPPAPLVVLEGVGSGQRAWADLITVLVWLDADEQVRLQRGLARDGQEMRERWLQWQHDEAELLADQRTDLRADLRRRTD